MTIESDASDVLKFLADVKQGENDPQIGRYQLGGEEILKWVEGLTAERLNDAVELLDGNGYITRLNSLGTRPFTFQQIGVSPKGRAAVERAKADAEKEAADEKAKASRLRGPGELEPPLTADDEMIIDAFAHDVVQYFDTHPESTEATFSVERGSQTERRHVVRAVERLRKVGWPVKPNARYDSIDVERGSGTSQVAEATEDPWSGYPSDQMAELVPLLRRKLLDEDLARAFTDERAGRPCAVMMIDIDHFKKANTDLGHPGADKVLVGVADIIRSTVGRRGRVYRYGGEEISVLLPDFTVAEAMMTAERCRDTVEQRRWEADGLGDFRVTVSIGVSSAVAPISGAEVLKQADEAVYKSKDAGRNRVTAHR